MDWIEASVTTTSGAADAVSGILIGHGAKGTQILDRGDVPERDEGPGFGELYGPEIREALPETVTVKAWFSSNEDILAAGTAIASLKEIDGFDAGGLALTRTLARDEDWAENWKKYYKPMRVGRRLVIRPVWEEYREEPGDLVITMDPGLAFGTGTHETTRLCMELIEKHFRGGRALDIGTGSGILAVTLAKLGEGQVTAVDIDPIAVKAARENIALNGLEGRAAALPGDLTRDITGKFDFICANILADVIISLSGPAARLLADKGLFLASGIIRDRKRDVLDRFLEEGYRLVDSAEQGEWLALLFQHHA